MGFRDLREFLAGVNEFGMLRLVEGAHWDLEIGAVAEMLQNYPENPVVLFDKIPGYPPGFRVLANHQNSIKKQALVLGISPEQDSLELLRSIRERRRQVGYIPPKEVSDGPVLENSDVGEKVNLLKFPTPKWRSLEGGRYIGTGTLVINRDPDDDWVNMSCYRQMIHDKKTVGFFVEAHHHGMIVAKKYWAKGKPCPVVACYGQGNDLFQAATWSASWGKSELDVAGWIRGEPIEIIKGPLTGLPIPASAEIVVEGEVPPPDLDSRMEGPYREWPGYYSQEPIPQPVIQVKAVYHRNDPILTGPPGCDRNISLGSTPHAAMAVWEALERTALPGIQGVWAHCNGLFIVISLKQQFAGHAKMALLTATSARGSGSAYRYYVAVDEDIDPSNLTDVLWAMTTRCVPEDQIDIVRGTLSARIDPVINPAKRAVGDLTCGRVLINACKPWDWIDQFGKSMTFTPEYKKQIQEKWGHLIKK
ncbi:MAG: UbiD family decarboxylase [Deltaproteobacteria bacterium]|nr:UbiD family decarboxylase [Deltaproteobacteria bacterium]